MEPEDNTNQGQLVNSLGLYIASDQLNDEQK